MYQSMCRSVDVKVSLQLENTVVAFEYRVYISHATEYTELVWPSLVVQQNYAHMYSAVDSGARGKLREETSFSSGFSFNMKKYSC